MRKSLNAILMTLTLAIAAVAPTFAADAPAASAQQNSVVNINTAETAQLALLPRIGPKAAARIVEYRKANGGSFKKATDLMQVKGVGEKTFELLRPYVALDGKTTLTTKVSGPKKPRAAKARAEGRGAAAQ